MSVSSPYPTVRSSIRRFGSISGGTFSSRSFSRATSTPSAAVKVRGKVSSSALNVGSMSGRVTVGSVMGIQYAPPELPVQRGPQCRQPAVQGGGGGGYHAGVADVAVHQCFGVVHLDGYTGGGQQLAVPDAVVAQRVVTGDGDVGGWQVGQVLRAPGRHPRWRVGQVDFACVPTGERGNGLGVKDQRVGIFGE